MTCKHLGCVPCNRTKINGTGACPAITGEGTVTKSFFADRVGLKIDLPLDLLGKKFRYVLVEITDKLAVIEGK